MQHDDEWLAVQKMRSELGLAVDLDACSEKGGDKMEIRDEVSARGRNGWFRPKWIEVWLNDGVVRLWVWSKRSAGIAPVILKLTPADAARLAGLLLAPREDEVSRMTVQE